MAEQTVHLSVPAEAAYARTVRMMAANLAVICNMNVDDVDDVRMAAEEGFVLCCASQPARCEIEFSLEADAVRATFALGAESTSSGEASDLAELLLDAVCDEHGVSDDGATLYLVKRAGVAYGE